MPPQGPMIQAVTPNARTGAGFNPTLPMKVREPQALHARVVVEVTFDTGEKQSIEYHKVDLVHSAHAATFDLIDQTEAEVRAGFIARDEADARGWLRNDPLPPGIIMSGRPQWLDLHLRGRLDRIEDSGAWLVVKHKPAPTEESA